MATTNAYTFEDLIIEVAEFMGVAYYGADGDEAAQVPTDAHDLDKIERLVNQGVSHFINDAPQEGWRWQRPILSITINSDGTGPDNIDGDPARYLLPDSFTGTPDGPIRYAADSNHATHIEWCHEARIRDMRETVTNSSYPTRAAVRAYKQSQNDLIRWELIVWPDPQSAEVLEFPYTILFNKITNLTSRHPAGQQFDQVVLAACKMMAELDQPDLGNIFTSLYAQRLMKAYEVNKRMAPRKLGNMGLGHGVRLVGYERRWNDVTVN
jgi:hypothetical protein